MKWKGYGSSSPTRFQCVIIFYMLIVSSVATVTLQLDHQLFVLLQMFVDIRIQ